MLLLGRYAPAKARQGRGVALERAEFEFGPQLTFDPKAERFTGDRAEQANALLTRKYRAPFVVPERV